MGFDSFFFGKKSKDIKSEEKDEPIWDPAYMYYDNFGVLRLGREARDRSEELANILQVDDIINEEGKVWYMIEASWVRQWLRYTKTNRNVPCPGPIKNENLIEFDVDRNIWCVKMNLIQASDREGRAGEGDYRRVNENVWKKFAEMYPGSGPVITVSELPYEEVGNWSIDQESLQRIDRIEFLQERYIHIHAKKEKLKKKIADHANKRATPHISLSLPIHSPDKKEKESNNKTSNSKNDGKNQDEKENENINSNDSSNADTNTVSVTEKKEERIEIEVEKDHDKTNLVRVEAV